MAIQPRSSCLRTTGIRSCSFLIASFAAVVMIVQASTPSPLSGSVHTFPKAGERDYTLGLQGPDEVPFGLRQCGRSDTAVRVRDNVAQAPLGKHCPPPLMESLAWCSCPDSNGGPRRLFDGAADEHRRNPEMARSRRYCLLTEPCLTSRTVSSATSPTPGA